MKPITPCFTVFCLPTVQFILTKDRAITANTARAAVSAVSNTPNSGSTMELHVKPQLLSYVKEALSYMLCHTLGIVTLEDKIIGKEHRRYFVFNDIYFKPPLKKKSVDANLNTYNIRFYLGEIGSLVCSLVIFLNLWCITPWAKTNEQLLFFIH